MNKIVWQRLTAIISLIALILIVYAQVLHFGFVNIDDSVYVTRNTHVLDGLSFRSIAWAFTSTYAGFWHPMTWLSLMADAQLYGTWAGGYHLTNLLLHIASSLLLFAIFHKMTGAFWKSLLVAALFALHPLHVESVAWIAERKDVLSAFWGMLTIYAYVWYVENPGIKRYLLVLVLFVLGLMSKPMLVTLPFLLLLMDYWPLCRISFGLNGCNIENLQDKSFIVSKTASIKRLILEKIPLFILIIPISIVTFFAEHQFGGVESLKSFPIDMRISNAIMSYIRYIEKTIFPLKLSLYYPYPDMWPLWQVILAGSAIALISILAIRKLARYPYFTVGWLWYMGTLVPVIGLIQIGKHAMADRYSYIPLIGLSIILAWGVPDLFRRLHCKKRLLSIGSILIILVLSVLSWQRCQLWGDSYALWNDVLKNYQVAYAYNYRGLVFAEKGQYHMAIINFNSALQLNKKYVHALNNRALVYQAIGRYSDALKDYNQALNFQPQYADAYYNRGSFHLQSGQLDAAIFDFTKAINIDPEMADVFNNRGIAWGMKGQYEKSLADFNKALRINRKLAEAYCNRGKVYNIYKQYPLAVNDFTEALNIKPQYAAAYFNRGESFIYLGKHNDAIRDFRQVLNINAHYVPALSHLGNLLKDMKRYDESSVQYKKILQIKPDDQDALSALRRLRDLKRNDFK